MLSKIISHGADRESALVRLDHALASTVVLGLQTNLEFLRHLLDDDDVRRGNLDTELLDSIAERYTASAVPDSAYLAAAGMILDQAWKDADPRDIWSRPSGWRVSDPASVRVRFEPDVTVTMTGPTDTMLVSINDADRRTRVHDVSLRSRHDGVDISIDDVRLRHTGVIDGRFVWVHDHDTSYRVARRLPKIRSSATQEGSAEILSPMPGSVIAIHVIDGDHVRSGAAVVVVEAMKMEHALVAPLDGTARLLVRPGDQVRVGQALARIERPDTEPAGEDA
jgi:acetyl-CoA/propionyl-CoA carboxylase biotin carboxyl carrier protein